MEAAPSHTVATFTPKRARVRLMLPPVVSVKLLSPLPTRSSATLPPRPPTLSRAAYANVRNCRSSSEAQKRIYLEAIARCGLDKSRAEAEHNTQRRGQLRKGPAPTKLLPDEGLGVLTSESVFVRKTASQFSMSAADFKKYLDALLRYGAKRARNQQPTETERLRATSLLRAKVPARQDVKFF